MGYAKTAPTQSRNQGGQIMERILHVGLGVHKEGVERATLFMPQW
jgi:hypothetical protein